MFAPETGGLWPELALAAMADDVQVQGLVGLLATRRSGVAGEQPPVPPFEPAGLRCPGCVWVSPRGVPDCVDVPWRTSSGRLTLPVSPHQHRAQGALDIPWSLAGSKACIPYAVSLVERFFLK